MRVDRYEVRRKQLLESRDAVKAARPVRRGDDGKGVKSHLASSENELEEALIRHIESFLLELGSDFAFLGRQRRLRIGDQWFRVDLLFFHRRLRCLVVVDLKLGEFTHSDAGQMHLYLNYAREHWMYPGENPPVGLILCNKKDEAVAHYALEGLSNKVMAAEYQMVLPNEDLLTTELERTRKALEDRLSTEPDAGN